MAQLSVEYFYTETKLTDKVYFGIVIDTLLQEIAGLDVIFDVSSYLKILNYYPTGLLSVKNYVDIKDNLITFSQLTELDKPNFKGKGLIAVLECQPVKVGNAYLKFNFTLGSTIDCNFASKDGKDLLTSVQNRLLKIV